MEQPRSSTAGKFFRTIADFFDRISSSGSSAGSTREVEIIALGILFLGIITVATAIHGWFFLPWVFLFSVYFVGWAWIIFHSAAWPLSRRNLLLAFLLLVSFSSAIERSIAMFAFIALTAALGYQLLTSSSHFIRRERVSVIAIILLCFSAYDAFAFVIESRRSSAMRIAGALNLDCSTRTPTTCSALDTTFEIPDFWHESSGTNLMRDLQPVANLRVYADSATDNKIAFAAFSFAPEKLMPAITNFFHLQKTFLRSRGVNGESLKPERLMRSNDAELFVLQYESDAKPGYAGEKMDSNAIILFHQRRGTTWLFILDGTDIGAREFLLHRIISGFK